MLTTSTCYDSGVDTVNIFLYSGDVPRAKAAASSSAAAARKRTYHHGNLRAALVEAGLDLIAEKGVRAFTLREIGSRVGVSRMAAYRHFADKQDLLAAICEMGFQAFGDALEQARTNAPPGPGEQLKALAAAYVRFATEHRAHFEVMFGTGQPDHKPHHSEASKRSFRILEETIREGQQQGEIRPGDPVQLARAVWSMVHGVSLLRFGEPFVDFSTEVVWTGLAR